MKETMVHVFYARIDDFLDENRIQKKIVLLCKQRRDKILRCKNAKDKARSMTAGLLLRQALITEGLDYETLCFVTTKHGKIVIENRKDIYINLTHAGDYAACVVATQPVGIDIEDRERFQQHSGEERLYKIAKRSCSPEEMEYLKQRDSSEFGDRFIKLWTRKESFSKAKGLGMQIGFSSINTLEKGFYYEKIINQKYQLCVATLELEETSITITDYTKQLKMIEPGG